MAFRSNCIPESPVEVFLKCRILVLHLKDFGIFSLGWGLGLLRSFDDNADITSKQRTTNKSA